MKKTIALIICLSLLSSMTVFATDAEIAADAIPLAEHSAIPSEAVETLVALKIIEGDGTDLMLDKVLTRAEFVTILVRLLGNSYESTKVYFNDVDSDHWAASSIAVACEMGIVQGVGEGLFAPDNPLTLREMVKMLVSALGYDIVAQSCGGYPEGYMAVAQRLHLFEDMDGREGLIIKRNTAAQMIFNALDAEALITSEYNTNGLTVEIFEDSTFAGEALKIRKSTGVVTATEITGLSTAECMDEGFVKIGEKTFRTGETDINKYLGYNVTYYADYSENDDIKELLYVRPEENKNDVLNVHSRDISPETTTSRLVYTHNDRKKNFEISPLADILLNGMGTGGVDSSGNVINDIIPDNGYVTLIDNNRDSKADVVLVYDFETIVADTVNPAAYMAYDSENASNYVELDPQSEDYFFDIYENGVKASFENISAGSVLSVAKSEKNSDKKYYITVLVSNASVDGILTAVGDDVALIDENEYYIMKSTGDVIKNNLQKLTGRETTFHINAFGEIVGAEEKTESLFSYGYLVKHAAEGAISRKVLFKILTQEGAITIFNGAKKISVDGGEKKSAADAVSALIDEQLIRYRTNASGEIIAIDTPNPGYGGVGDTLEKSVTKAQCGSGYRYRKGVFGNYGHNYIADSETLVFVVPAQESLKSDESYYETYMADEYFGASEFYTFDGYDMEETLRVKVCVVDAVDRSAIELTDSSAIFAIEKIKTVIDVDGKETYRITGKDSRLLTVVYETYDMEVLKTRPEDSEYDSITANGLYQVGDLVQVKVNADGRAVKLRGILTGAFNKNAQPYGFFRMGTNEGRFYAGRTVSYGTLTKLDGMKMVIDVQSAVDTVNDVTSSEVPYLMTDTVKYYIFDVNERIYRASSIDELRKHTYAENAESRVAVITNSGNIDTVVIYNFSD